MHGGAVVSSLLAQKWGRGGCKETYVEVCVYHEVVSIQLEESEFGLQLALDTRKTMQHDVFDFFLD